MTTSMEVIAATAAETADRANIPVVLHLDYADSFGILRKVKCYISLHGGSGVEDSMFQKAISLGINKASVYSQMSKGVIGRIKKIISVQDMPDMVEVLKVMKDAVKESVIDRLKVFSTGKESNISGSISIPDTIAGNSINKLIKDVTRQALRE